MKRTIYILLIVFGVILIGLSVFAYSNLRDQNRDYSVDITLVSPLNPLLSVGVAMENITPDVPDRWVDNDHNAKYQPQKGDTYEDLNHDGIFNSVWMAGFSTGRAANGVHDSLWARTIVIDDGENRIALTSIDAIGFYNNDVIDVRCLIPDEVCIDYLIVSSTHSHQVPDLMGLWGEKDMKSGVDPQYKELVKQKIATSVIAATKNLRPARLLFAENHTHGDAIVKDTREPQVKDSGIRVMQAVSEIDQSVIATVVSMGNHPETIWSSNLLISSDFPHYLREALEENYGGMGIFVQGCLGGLMCTHPSLSVIHPVSGDTLQEVSWEKVEAVGRIIADGAIEALKNPVEVMNEGINLRASTIRLRLDNDLFFLAAAMGIFNTGMSGWRTIRSEIAAWTIGPATFATVPGELYPEIANGGVEAPQNGDFMLTQPIESPSIRSQMNSPFTFVFGLANDEIGYIIPKSQWDVKAPFAYGKEKAQYGEINSLGPETAPTLYRGLSDLLRELNELRVP